MGRGWPKRASLAIIASTKAIILLLQLATAKISLSNYRVIAFPNVLTTANSQLILYAIP